jgi:GNAT superfamily N-acetyltransferase
MDSMNNRLTGYSDLPAGTIAAVVTYLEMEAAPAPQPVVREGWSLVPLRGEAARYRELFRQVGEPWLWFSRLIMRDEALRGIVDHPSVKAFALEADGADIGLLELDFRVAGQCELSFFGLVPEAIGQGWGRVLMQEALRRAWQAPIRRLWVHTCSLDHPRALGFYIRSGFRPYKRAVEIADDPRLKGYLPLTAAPQMPVMREAGVSARGGPRQRLARWAGRRRAQPQ